VIANPVFLYRPTYREMMKYYPAHAYAVGLAGSSTIHCDVTVDGKAANCKILHEEPRGESFGYATLALAKFLKFRPRTRDGVPEDGGIFETTVHWSPPVEK
jgi:TonB family protein